LILKGAAQQLSPRLLVAALAIEVMKLRSLGYFLLAFREVIIYFLFGLACWLVPGFYPEIACAAIFGWIASRVNETIEIYVTEDDEEESVTVEIEQTDEEQNESVATMHFTVYGKICEMLIETSELYEENVTVTLGRAVELIYIAKKRITANNETLCLLDENNNCSKIKL
jgi:hypothetical protein